MNDFSLTPFLRVVAAGGIRVTIDDYKRIQRVLRANGSWTIASLRGVLLTLLVHHFDQEEAFLREFDKFFDPALQTQPLSADELAAIRRELKALAETNESSLSVSIHGPSLNVQTAVGTESQHSDRPKHTRLIFFVASAILIAVVGFLVAESFRRPKPTPFAPVIDNPSPTPTATPIDNTTPETTPRLSAETLPEPSTWRLILGLAILSLFLLIVHHDLAQHLAKRVVAPTWNRNDHNYVPFHQLGAKPAPCLEPTTLGLLADSLNYFQSGSAGKTLDVRRSVDATARHSGLPEVVFLKRKELRTVYILEDSYAQPLVWNHTPKDLAAGLSERGIVVRHGRFAGSPTRFWIDDGPIELLEDLDTNRNDYILLLFSDGLGLRFPRDTFVFEDLARWPFVAWMELREPSFWDERTSLINEYGLPVYPASERGLVQAMQSFVTEQGKESHCVESGNLRNFPLSTGSNTELQVERLLGDALPWAQACAMIQPLTLGLADALRRKFQPHLPVGCIERLFYLPGTKRSVAGLTFSVPVVAVLRNGFRFRWEEDQQEEILDFILDKIDEIEPKLGDSLAHLSWRWVRERVHLELDPDAALEQIARLERTPLKNAIRSELKNVVLPGTPLREPDSPYITRIPLRCRPEEQRGFLHLSGLVPGISMRLYRSDNGQREGGSESTVSSPARLWRAFIQSEQSRPILGLLAGWLIFSVLVASISRSLAVIFAVLNVWLMIQIMDQIGLAWSSNSKLTDLATAVRTGLRAMQLRNVTAAFKTTLQPLAKVRFDLRTWWPVMESLVVFIGFIAITMLTSPQPSTVANNRIAFVINSASDESRPSDFWARARLGAMQASKDLGIAVQFYSAGYQSAAAQKTAVDDLLAAGVRWIAINPTDPAGQTQLINEAAKQAVVITVDTDAPNSNRFRYFGTNNLAAGRQAGELLKEVLPQGGRILVVAPLEAAVSDERFRGIREVLTAGTVISDIITIPKDETDRLIIKSKVADALVRYPDVRCLVSLSSYSGPAILSAVRDANKINQVKILAFDQKNETLEGIKSGAIYATIVEDPFEIGYQAVELVDRTLNSLGAVPFGQQVFIPALVVKKNSVDDFQRQLNQALPPT